MVGTDDEVHVHDMHREATANRAAQLGIRSLPAVIIDGKLTRCCGEGLFGAGDPPVWEFTSSAQSEALVPAELESGATPKRDVYRARRVDLRGRK